MLKRHHATAAMALTLALVADPEPAHAQYDAYWGGGYDSSYDPWWGWYDWSWFCAWPDLASCQSESYRQSYCGQQHYWTCGDVVAQSYLAERSGHAATTPMIPPEDQGLANGGVQTTGVRLGYDAENLDSFWNFDATYRSAALSSLVPSGDGSEAYMPAWLDPYGWRKHPAWESSGATMNSCEEYVYEKYYDYKRFEDVALSCGDGWECIYEMAFLPSTPGIAGRALRTKSGAIMSPQIDPALEGPIDPTQILKPRLPASAPTRALYRPGTDRPKNAFFSLYPAFVTDNGSYPPMQAKVDAILATIAGTPGYDIVDELDWHEQMHGLVPALSEAERADVDARVERYRTLVERYEDLRAHVAALDANAGTIVNPALGELLGGELLGDEPWDDSIYWAPPPSSWHGGGYLPMPAPLDPRDPHNQLDRVKAEIFDLLVEEWDRGPSGCLAAGNYACDWSPKAFALRYLGLYQAEQERDHQRCVQGTLGGFATVPAAARQSIAALEAHFDTQAEVLAQELDGLPRLPDAPTTLGSSMVSGHMFGDPDWFSAGYAIDVGWQLAVLEKTPSGNVCRLGGRAWGDLWAGANLLGVWSYDLVDTRTEVAVHHDNQLHVHSHMIIDDEEIYPAVDETLPLNHAFHESGREKFDIGGVQQTIVLLAVPVTVHAWADLTVGYEFHASSGTPSGCTDTSVPFALGAQFKPWVSADAHGTAAIGVPLLQAGLKADLTLIRAELPVDAGLAITGHGGNLQLELTTDGRLELDELAGKVSLFVEYVFDSSEKELFDWRGFHQSIPLWHTHDTVWLASLAGLPAHPNYPELAP
jgi:hypothetical protein